MLSRRTYPRPLHHPTFMLGRHVIITQQTDLHLPLARPMHVPQTSSRIPHERASSRPNIYALTLGFADPPLDDSYPPFSSPVILAMSKSPNTKGLLSPKVIWGS